MNVQVRKDEKRKSFILDGSLVLQRGDQVLKQDAARASDLVFGTLLAKEAASGKWVPFTDETATDGTAVARGVYVGLDVAAADLVAGDVAAAVVLIGGDAKLDRAQVIIEGGKDLETVFGTGTIHAKTVEDQLREIGLFIGESEDTTSFEN